MLPDFLFFATVCHGGLQALSLSPTHCPISWAIFTSVAVDCIDSFPLAPQEKKRGKDHIVILLMHFLCGTSVAQHCHVLLGLNG